MKKLTGLLAILALSVVSVLPAMAADVLQPCSTSNTTVGYDDLSEGMDTPMLPLDNTTVTYVLDLAGNALTKDRANVTVDVSWDDPVSDFDIDVNGETSAAFTVLDDSTESVSLTNVKHCGTITVSVDNFAASPLAALTVSLDVR